MREKNNTKNLNIRVSPIDLERLAWLAKLLGKSQGEIVRELVNREYTRVKNAVTLPMAE